MKYIFFVSMLLFGFQITAQNSDVQNKIDFVNLKIQNTKKGERLTWLDSLTKLTYRNAELKYDANLRQTISLAIKLDSLSLATIRVNDLIGFQNNYLGKPEEGLKIFKNYKEKLSTGENFGSIGFMYLNAADSYYYLSDIDKSLAFYEIAKTFALKANNQRLLGYALLYTGYNQSDLGQFSKSSNSLKEAANIFIKLKDTFNILGSKNSLSILYSKNAFYKEAEKERAEAILIAKKTNNSISLRNLYFNAAEDNLKTNDAVNQIINLKKSIQANSKSDDELLVKPLLLTSLIKAYSRNDSLELAESNFKALEAIYIKDKSEDKRSYYVDAKKELSFAKANVKDALKYGEEYLQIYKGKKKYEEVMFAEKFLGDVYKSKNDNTNANIHFLRYFTIKDSITSVQNVKSLSYYQTLYETEKRDLEIENQKGSISLLNSQNENKNQLLVFGALGLLILFGVIIFYRSFLNAKKREQAQQEFSHELIKTQEKERTRIAKDLHDGLGQLVTLIKIKAQNKDQKELSNIAQQAIDEVRSISRDLYPVILSKLGLTDSIEQLLLDLDEETDLFISLEIDDVNTSFNEDESLNFYRFIQESVNNVLKHANAKTLIVNVLKQSDGIKILIKDNGEGFDVSDMSKQNSLGLKTMAERISMLKGSFAIKSKTDEGTSILVQIPF
ncbi:sensor histidine kinase [Lacinutrix jangbogonensis]|uniref:sensor histidine kinase n=1 Tax=Lacinutrix jangbogonensis TaxID=1469557 RepID=UPI0009DC982E|nr:sensor histidine kinase [Lacinutrix jangbogonensis]